MRKGQQANQERANKAAARYESHDAMRTHSGQYSNYYEFETIVEVFRDGRKATAEVKL
jgi:hypothetical protein